MPRSQDLRINVGLSNFASGYTNGKLMADLLVPTILTDKRKGTYFTRNRKDVSTLVDDEVGQNSEANEIDYAVGQTSFNVVGRALLGYVSNEEINEADDPNSPKEDKADNLMLRLMLAHEKRVFDLLTTAGNYAVTAAAAALWSTNPTTIITDVQGAVASLAPDTGENTILRMIMCLEAWQAMSRNSALLGLRAGGRTENGVLKPSEVAEQLGIDEILVTDVQRNTANRGQAATYVRMWDKTKVALIRVPKGEVRSYQGCFAASFRQRKPATGTGIVVQEWEEPKRGETGSIGLKVSMAEVQASVQTDMGVLLTTVMP